MKKVLLGVLAAALMAPLAGCLVYERPYGDAYYSQRPYGDAYYSRRPYYRPYPYRPYYPYRYGYQAPRFDD